MEATFRKDWANVSYLHQRALAAQRDSQPWVRVLQHHLVFPMPGLPGVLTSLVKQGEAAVMPQQESQHGAGMLLENEVGGEAEVGLGEDEDQTDGRSHIRKSK